MSEIRYAIKVNKLQEETTMAQEQGPGPELEPSEIKKKEDKKPYANYYIGISVAFGLMIGTALGNLIPALGIAMGSGIGLIIGVVIGTYIQKKHDNKT